MVLTYSYIPLRHDDGGKDNRLLYASKTEGKGTTSRTHSQYGGKAIWLIIIQVKES
jgi:hypothetical protein